MIRRLAKAALRYEPLAETRNIRALIAHDRVAGRPYCPEDEGDLIYGLIRDGGYKHCLQTGFGTGSTALYMLHAVGSNGRVISIDWSDTNFNEVGKTNLKRAGLCRQHTLIEESSHAVMPRFSKADSIGFVFIDGWK